MKALIQVIIIAVILVGSYFGRQYLIEHAPVVPPKSVRTHVPTVEVVETQSETRALVVTSEGTISAPVRLGLAPEVAGRAIALAPGFEEGASVAAGTPLVTIDPADYELARDAAQANLEAAQAALLLEEESARAAIADWRELNDGTPPALVARTPQLASARARIATAEVALAQAKLALRRTQVSMPFDGRIVTKSAELGQRLDPMAPVATIERAGALEVRLSLELSELGLLGLDPNGSGASALEIKLEAEVGGQLRSWRARGVRTAADLSPANPTVTLIATVEAALDGGSLPVPGLFVRARIRGQEAHVHELPRRALGIDGRIMVVDPRRHLTSRKVVVRQTTEQQVLITSGLEDGELVVITPPPVVVEGMTVRLPDDPVAPAAAPSSAPGTSSMPTSPSATDSDQ